MQAEAFRVLIERKLVPAFPGWKAPGLDTARVWLSCLADLPDAQVEAAVELVIRRVEQLYPSSNLGAMLRRMACPKLTEATIQEHLLKAHAMMAEGRSPWDYLAQLNPALPKLAEDGGLFDRQASHDSIRHASREIAKQAAERIENETRGFSQPALPDARPMRPELPAPEACTSPDAAKRNLAMIRETLAEKGAKIGGILAEQKPEKANVEHAAAEAPF